MASVHLALQDVSVRFGNSVLLDRVNLEIEPGEAVALIGPSGQGKTVLLKLFAGLLKASEGRVYIDGQLLDGNGPPAGSKIGMLFQKNALFDSLSVAENIAFALREASPFPDSEIRPRVTRALEQVGLAHAADLFPDEISGGMQKRLGIARALALEPKFVLYDDPTAGLDPITSRRIVDLILDLRAKQKSTVVAVTNDMSRAYQLADRVAMVVGGEVIVTGSRAETLAHPDPRVRQFVRGELEGPLTVKA